MGGMSLTFMGYSQNDAHEVLRFILEKMHKELNVSMATEDYTEFKLPPTVSTIAKQVYSLIRKQILNFEQADEWKKFSTARENSIISSIFGGSLLSEVVCEHCRNKSQTFENTLDLPLDIYKERTMMNSMKSAPVSLTNCLELFTCEVIVHEYFCSKCKKKGRAKRRVTLWKQPEILVIQLKRFVHDQYGNLEALKDEVSFPLHGLDLQNFTHKESKGNVLV